MQSWLFIRCVIVASSLCMALAQPAFATSVEPLKDVQADPAPCLTAADDDKAVASLSGFLIRQYADGVKAGMTNGQCRIQMHFDH